MGKTGKTQIGAVLVVFLTLSVSAMAQQPYPPDEFLEFLKDTYERHDDDLAQYLISELTFFIELYPESELLPEAYFYRAQTWLDRKDEYRAFADLMRIMFLYPSSDIRESANYSLNSIVQREKDFQTMLPEIREILDSSPIATDIEERYLAYIRFLYSLSIRKLVPGLIDVAHEFVARYPESEAVEEIHHWLARSCELAERDEAADACYRKYLVLYKDSEHLPMMMVRWANHLYSRLDRPDTAVVILTDLIRRFGSMDDAADALYLRARIKMSEYRDYEGAIADARRLSDEYPEHLRVYDALMLIGELYNKRLKRYRLAVDTYEEVVRRFPGDERAVPALITAAEIFMDELELYEEGAERYSAVAAMFSYSARAADCAWEAAEIYEKEIEDCRRALTAYETVVRRFPDSREAKEAAEKIEDIMRDIANGDC